tara:strand:+ start:666 stop:2612 length:1947 start_codon:yes stop_codon:yes gene_type:complete
MAITNNPKNPDSKLFKKLTRLFSGPIIDYRAQTIRKYRRHQLDKFANTFKSLSGQSFKRTAHNPFENLQTNMIATQNRVERYADFDQMEYEPIIASALDIYADEMTTSSDLQPLLKINCPNEEIKAVLHSLYHNILNVEFNLFGWCRTMCKYGDMFLYVDIQEEYGIKNVIALPYDQVERIEGEDPTNPNYIQYQWNSAGMTFESWQVAHLRILGNDKYAPYGTSALEPSRRIWRQLTLLEDAMMAYRIVRAPDRRVFYIDTGNIPPQDVEQFMQKTITSLKRNQLVDPASGRVDLRYNPLSVEEDYFIPVRNGVKSTVENLTGGSYTGDIEDVKYLKDKLFAALKVPQSYLFRGEGAEEDKQTLAQKDIRFARTIQRLQRAVVSELEKIGIIHLYSLGYRTSDLISFKLRLNNPSKIAELQELEHWKTKFDAAGGATEGFFSKRWIAEHIFSLSEEEFLRNQREQFYDRKFTAALEAAATEEEGMEEGLGGGEMGELGGDLGGDEELDLGDDEGGDEGGEEEDVLLAAPGNRDDNLDLGIRNLKNRRNPNIAYTTKGSNGKAYRPVRDDKRNIGGRHRKTKGSWGDAAARPTVRNIWKAPSLIGLEEDRDSNYDNEERLLNESTKDIRDLITELESTNNGKKTQQET